MRIALMGRVLLLSGLAACAGRSEESKETTRVAADTMVERKQVVDTFVVKTDTTIAADTSRVGGGVSRVDTVQAGAPDTTHQQ